MDRTDNAAQRAGDEPAGPGPRGPGGPGSLAMSVEEVSKLLGISKWLAYEMVACGQIPAIRFGRRLVVPRAALEAMLAGAAPVGTAERSR